MPLGRGRRRPDAAAVAAAVSCPSVLARLAAVEGAAEAESVSWPSVLASEALAEPGPRAMLRLAPAGPRFNGTCGTSYCLNIPAGCSGRIPA